MSEISYNNTKHSVTKIAPFYAYYRYALRINRVADIKFRSPASEMYGHITSGLHKLLSPLLEVVTESTANCYNKKWQSIENFRK